ncbi:MAG: discoidin domain-containing protein, partial [Pirellulaceae bacterium]
MNCFRRVYLSLFAFGAMFIAIQEIDAAPILLSQNLGASAYSANGGNAALAFDGNFSNLWNSNGFAPAWIEVDLGSVYSLEEFRLRVDQTPSGNTTHQIW